MLDAYAVPSAHLVGVSAGGAFAQLLALEFPGRVRSLVLIRTSAVTPGDRGLPPSSDQFGRFFSTATVDWSDRDSAVDYLVGYCRMLAGGRRPFDEAYTRDVVRRDVQRARDFAARRNHDLIAEAESATAALSSIPAPPRHRSPVFPVEHGDRIQAETSEFAHEHGDGGIHHLVP